jgi:hypothetical protein
MDIIELKDFIQDTEQALVDKGYHRVEVTIRLGDQRLDSYRREFHVTVWSAKIDKFGHLESKEFSTPSHEVCGIDRMREVMMQATAFVANMPSMEIAVANTPITTLEDAVDSISTVGLDSGSDTAGFAADELSASIKAAVAKYKANLHGNGLLLTDQS